ncbi:MAG: hypothetical protein HKN07_14550, partial [Acidimicrobiia bacterium]|nr:hypothetical protein [Acidimicrobiia bacterium]
MSTRSRFLAIASVLTLAVAFLPGVSNQVIYAQEATPTPWFSVEVYGNGMWGGDFAPNGEVTVTVDKGTGPVSMPGSPFGTDDSGSFTASYDAVVDFVAGDLVEVSDGTTTKTLSVANLTVDSVDEATNVVSGAADANSTVWVSIHGEPGDPGRTVTADESGLWTTDFDDPGDSGGTWDLQPGDGGYAQRSDDDGDSTNFDWRVRKPEFKVDPFTDTMWGQEFLPNGSVTVTVDGTDAPGSPFAADGWGNFGAGFGPELDLQFGDVVIVTDGATTKDHTVFNVAVASVDAETNVVAGTTDPNSDVRVDIHGQWEAARTVTANGSGNWSTDFDDPGEFGGTFDLGLGDEGYVNRCDTDGDCTNAEWRVPNPVFQVMAGSAGSLWANDFTPYGSLSISINGADAGTHALDEWGNFDGNTYGLSFDLPVGATVVVSDGATTKDHIVTNLAVTAVDEIANTVTGSADPGDIIDVWDHGEGRSVQVTAGASTGVWIADFDGLVAFGPGTNGNSGETDADGDQTYAFWGVPDPRFKAGVDDDSLSGWDWLPNSTVDVTVDGGAPHSFDTDEWGNFGQSVSLDIAVGQHLVATDGNSTKDMIVRNLIVTAVDADTDVVTGTSEPGDVIHVNVHSENGPEFQVTADPVTGIWTADFAGFWDIDRGTSGSAFYYEADGDETERFWRISDPWIGASVLHDEVWANDFPDEPAGQTLYYRLDDPTTPEVDFEYTMPLIVISGWTEAGDRSFGRYDVQAGDIFTVRNRPFSDPLGDGLEKVLDVSRIEVTGVNGDTDVITGFADPAEGPDICVWSQDAQLCNGEAGLVWDAAGNWTADFGSVGSDVKPGHWNSASQYDADSDETHYWWNLPPWVVVELAEEDAAGEPLWPDAVRAEEWVGPVVTLTINGFVIDSWTVTGDGHYTFELADFDVEVGDIVTLSDSVNTKSITVEMLSIDQINFAGDSPPNTVFGKAVSERDVRVQASASVGGWWAERWVNADASGDFSADFGTPGNGWREQWTADFGGAEGLGRHMLVEIYDEDNDRVETRTCEGVPRIEVTRSDGRVEAYDFPVGATLTLEITGAPDPFTAVSQQNPENPCETIATFDLGEFEIPEEATVTVTDDAGTPPVTHTLIAFTIDNVDPEADTISGTSPSGARVLVQADGNWRYVNADDSGNWLANFAVSGDEPGEEEVIDLGPGSSGVAIVLDEFGNTTELSWRISAANFQVDPSNENLWANDFEPNSSVSATVDQGAGAVPVPGSPFVTDEWGNFGTGWDAADLDLHTNDVVVLSDGFTTKDHDVTALTVATVDSVSNIVSGRADPDSEVWVDIHGHWESGRTVTADEFGDWET